MSILQAAEPDNTVNSITLKVNQPLIVFEHIKLYARVPVSIYNRIGIPYATVLLGSASNPLKKCVAILQYSEYIAEGSIDLSNDIYDTLELEPDASITLMPIAITNLCTKLVLECTKPEQIKTELLLAYLLQKPVMDGTIIYHKKQRLQVKSMRYKVFKEDEVPASMITRSTQISYVVASELEHTGFDEIGGLGEELIQLKEMLELPIKHPALFKKTGISAPKGILLYGPPGTGKTMLAKAIAHSINATFYTISGPSIAAKYYGESETKLRALFDKAKENAPAIIFIDEVDALAGKRANMSEVDRRICTQLLVLMDGIQSNSGVIVIAATNLPDDLDPAVRRGGRFDVEIEVKVPDKKGRAEILTLLLKRKAVSNTMDTEALAAATNGYVGADLAAVIRQAGLIAIREHVTNNTPLTITTEYMYKALKRIRPSTLRQYTKERSPTKLTKVIGHDKIIEEILNHLQIPSNHHTLFSQFNITPVNGILLYGPPGTGKTMLAKAIADTLGYNLVFIKGPELLSKYVGETERQIRKMFEQARMGAPSIILLDEIDSFTAKRTDTESTFNQNTILGQLLTQLTTEIQTERDVILIGTTNRPDLLDPALLRAGRFDLKYELTPPSESALYDMLCSIFKDIFTHDMQEEFKAMANMLHRHNITGAYMNGLLRQALLLACKNTNDDNLIEIKLEHIQQAVDKIIASATEKYMNTKQRYAGYY